MTRARIGRGEERRAGQLVKEGERRREKKERLVSEREMNRKEERGERMRKR